MGDVKMVIVNDKIYNKILKKISFGEYSVIQNGKRREGLAPFILFNFDDIFLGLETTYDKKWLEELKINDKKNISKYISDVTYEDEKGWMSLITRDMQCFIYKIDNNIFEIKFSCDTEECGEYYKILLNEKIEIM